MGRDAHDSNVKVDHDVGHGAAGAKRQLVEVQALRLGDHHVLRVRPQQPAAVHLQLCLEMNAQCPAHVQPPPVSARLATARSRWISCVAVRYSVRMLFETGCDNPKFAGSADCRTRERLPLHLLTHNVQHYSCKPSTGCSSRRGTPDVDTSMCVRHRSLPLPSGQ